MNKPVRVEVGCGPYKQSGYLGVDLDLYSGVDLLGDLHHLPFHDSSVDFLLTQHTLEHVEDPLQCIREIYRVVKPGGLVKIVVPHYSSSGFWMDLTHRNPFSVRSFEYFDRDFAHKAGFPCYLKEVNLRTLSRRLIYWPPRLGGHSYFKRQVLIILNRLLSALANLSPTFCERFWCYWVGGFFEVHFELEVMKD